MTSISLRTAFCLLATTPLVSLQDRVPAAPGGAKPGKAIANFAWPERAKATVTEDRLLGNGKTRRWRYTIRVGHADELLRLSFGDFELLESDGVDFGMQPAKLAEIAPSRAWDTGIPDLLVSKAGAFVDVAGVEGLPLRLTEFVEQFRPIRETETASYTRVFNSKYFGPRMAKTVKPWWHAWVGYWLDFDLENGQTRKSRITLKVGRIELPATLTLVNHGPIAGRPGFVRLSMKAVAKGEEARKAYASQLRNSATLKGFRYSESREVITHVKTLRPIRAVWEHSQFIDVASRHFKSRGKTERRTYTFDWDK